MPDSFDGFCSLWLEADPGGDEGYVFTSPAFFNYVFDKHNFSIVSNPFDYNKPYALSTHD